MAEVVATSHDAHKSTNLVAHGNTLGHHIFIGLCGGEFNVHRLMARLCLGYQIGQRQIGIRTSHEVAMVVVQQILLGSLRHTAQKTNDQGVLIVLRFLFALATLCIERLQTMINLLLCVIPNRTGVQEDGISLFQLLGGLITSHLHHRCNHL